MEEVQKDYITHMYVLLVYTQVFELFQIENIWLIN